MTPPHHRFATALFPALALAAAGCGNGLNDCTLTGQVTYQGKPVVYGVVIVQGASGIKRSRPIQPDGRYIVEGLPAGPVKITVEGPPEPPDPATRLSQPTHRPAGPPPNLPVIDRSKWVQLPEKYADPDQSGLATTVKRGTNPFDIDMP